MTCTEGFDAFRRFLEKHSGIVLGENKHYLVTSRLTRLMKDSAIDSLPALVSAMENPSQRVLKEQVIDAMTTNETMWFRDTHPFDILKQDLFPELLANKRSLRFWSAACSTGQEPYSMLMAFDEFLKTHKDTSGTLDVSATDLSPTVLDEAKGALYDKSTIGRGLVDERLHTFFEPNGDLWQVKQEIRRKVSFKQLNLMDSFSLMGKFDVIFCRNVLIYFSPELKGDILNRLAGQLNLGGYLFLGSSETPSGYSDAFEMRRIGRSVVYQKKS